MELSQIIFIVLCILALLFRVSGTTDYWQSKLIFSALILVPFALQKILIKYSYVLTPTSPWRNHLLTCALGICLLAIYPGPLVPIVYAPLEADDLQLIKWIRDHDDNIFPVTDLYRLSWIQALAYPRRVHLPSNARELAALFKRHDISELLLQIFFQEKSTNELVAIKGVMRPDMEKRFNESVVLGNWRVLRPIK